MCVCVQCRSGEEEGTLTGHRVCLCVQAFKVIDTNSDGFITREDLQEIMTSLCTLARMRGLPPSHTQACTHVFTVSCRPTLQPLKSQPKRRSAR